MLYLKIKEVIELINLFLYKILTQIIIILSRLRDRLNLVYCIRKDRTFKEEHIKYPGYELICCDCGLSHQVWIERYGNFEIEYSRPIRPKGYDYSFRKFGRDSRC